MANREALLQVNESMRDVLAAVQGYKQMCIEHGFSVEAAEQMSIEYHRHLLVPMFKAKS